MAAFQFGVLVSYVKPEIVNFVQFFSKTCFSYVCSVFQHHANARSAPPLRCSVYIKHKATITPTAITPNVENASQVIKDTPFPC